MNQNILNYNKVDLMFFKHKKLMKIDREQIIFFKKKLEI